MPLCDTWSWKEIIPALSVLVASLIYIGYHKRLHEDEARHVTSLEDGLSQLVKAHNERTEKCPVHVLAAKQEDDILSLSKIEVKVDELNKKVDMMIGWMQGKGSNLTIL